MKLRNKQSGEIKEFVLFDGKEMQSGLTLENLAREWEDYNLAEPLIEDEKIRKALRAVYDAAPHRDNVVYFDGRWTFRGDKFEVMFDDREIKIEGWTEGKAYHIEELCGEGEE